jgi:hypothetical protein
MTILGVALQRRCPNLIVSIKTRHYALCSAKTSFGRPGQADPRRGIDAAR